MIVENVITETQLAINCKFCNSVNVVRFGFTLKRRPRYLCNNCKRTFVTINSPERMHYSSDVIASAINQFYESASLHKIKRQLELDFGVSPSPTTIYRWILRYSKKQQESPYRSWRDVINDK